MAAQRRLFIFSVLFLSAALFAGCGGNNNRLAPPPSGNYSNSSMNGTYAFTTTGTNTGGTFSIAGSLQANGSGTITGGTVDINSPGTSTLTIAAAITGTYNVTADGRGTATITTSGGSFHLDFVLASTSHGFVTRFDNVATGSGSLDLQSSSAFTQASITGTYAFLVSGDSGASTSGGEAIAGEFPTDGSGDISGSGGVEDINNGGTPTFNSTIAAATGVISAPDSTSGRGTIALGGITYAYYIISASHLKLLEIDTASLLAGDAFSQTSTTVAAGSYVFTLGGSTSSGPFAAAGLLNLDGTSAIQTGSMEDYNSGGNISQAGAISLSGSYSAGSRSTATISGNASGTTFVFYPSSGGLLLIEMDSGTVIAGIATPQTGSGFSNASLNGTYAVGFTGANTSSEVDFTAQYSTSGNGSLSGALDLNDPGLSALTADLALSGTYSVASNGRGTGMLNTTATGGMNIAFYAVSGSQIQFVELDNTQLGLGTFVQQQ